MEKKLTQLQAQIAKLEQQVAKVRQKEVADVVKKIQAAIRVYGLTAQDLGLGAGKRGPAAAGRRAGRSTTDSGVKYRDEAGNTWGGRGPRPRWLRTALDAGKSLSDFEVGAKLKANGRTKAPAPSRKNPGSAVRYRDASGNTWGGRGPRPAWFKAALKSGVKPEELLA